MTDTAITADIIPLHKPETREERTRRLARERKQRQRARETGAPAKPAKPVPAVTAVTTVTPVTPKPVTVKPVTRHAVTSRSIAQLLLVGTSFALAGVGVTMNGWYAHTLGSSEIAGWVFTAIGIAADAMALALPGAAAIKWQARQRGVALAGWLVWGLVFLFTLTAGVGFASVNITDVTSSRASRVTPAVTQAQIALDDAKAARDRECKGGVGKVCREREAAVTDRRIVLEDSMRAVEQKADPQIEQMRAILTWVSLGVLKPTAADFAMLRLVLISLLPQLGGILLMISRR